MTDHDIQHRISKPHHRASDLRQLVGGDPEWVQQNLQDISGQLLDVLEQAQGAVRQTSRHRALLTEARRVLYAVGPDGLLSQITPTVEPLLGYTPSEIVGRPFAERVHPEDRARCLEDIQHILAGQTLATELRVLTKSGDVRWLRAANRPVFEGDRVIGVEGVLSDVTEHKRQEQALLESEARLKAQYQSIPIPTYTWQGRDDDFVLIDYNEAAQEITRGQIRDYIGTKASELYQDRPDIVADLWRCFTEESSIEREMLYTFKTTGESRYFAAKYAFAPPDWILVHTEDITERKRAEEESKRYRDHLEQLVEARTAELLASEECYRSLFDRVPVSLYRSTPDGQVVDANLALVKVLDYPDRESLLEVDIADKYVNPEDRQRWRALIEREEVVRDFEYQVRKRDGTIIWVCDSARAVQDAEGRVLYYEGSLEDVTERIQTDTLIHIQHGLALTLSTTSRLDEGLRLCLEAALQASGMDCGGVYLVDKSSGALDLVVYKGLSSAFIKSASHCDADSAHARLVSAGKPVYTQHQSLGVPLDETKRREGLRSIAILPVCHEGQVTGCLNVASHTLDHMSAFARDALETIVAHIGISISRLQAEEILRKSEEQYKRLVERAPDIVYMFSDKRGGLFYSERVRSILGYEPAYLLEHPLLWHNSIHPDDLPLVDKAIADFGGGQEFNIEYRISDAQGHWHWLRDRSIGLRKEGGEAIVEGLASDITERKQAEEALRVSEERYRTILQTAIDGFWVTDAQGRLLEVNAAYCQMSGYSEQELLAMSIPDLEAAESPTAIAAHIQQVIAHGEDRFESRHRRKDGITFSVEVSTQHRPTKGGHFVGFIRDITERKRAAEALRQSEARYRELFESMREGVVISGPDGRISAVNPAAVALLGYSSREELVGMPSVEIYRYPEHRSPVLEELTEKNQIDGYELMLKKRDGTPIHGLGSATVRRDGAGGILRIVGVFQDITERKRAEEALRVSEERYRVILQTAMDGFWVTDAQGRLLEVNAAYCQMSGYSEQELLAMSIPDLEAAESPTETAAHIQQVIAHGEDRFESRHRRKDGSTFGVELSVQYQPIEGGRFAGFIRDITDRQRAEEALRAGEEKYRILIEQSLQGVMVVQDFRIVFANTAFAETAGYTVEELLSLSPEAVKAMVHPDDRALVWKRLRARLAGKPVPSHYGYRGIRKGGTVRRLEMFARRIEYQGKPAIQGVIADITERQRAEEELKRNTRRLESLRGVDRAILTNQSLELVGQEVLSHLRGVVPFQGGAIVLLDHKAGEATVLAAAVDEGEPIVPSGSSLPLTMLAGMEAFTEALGQGEPQMIEDLGALPQSSPWVQLLQAKGIRAVAAAPLMTEDTLIGVLAVGAQSPGGFLPEHLGLAREAADSLATAIQQVRLFEQVQQHAGKLEQHVAERTRDLTTLYEVTAIAARSLDLHATLDLSLKTILNALPFRVASIHLLDRTGHGLVLAAQRGTTPHLAARLDELASEHGPVGRVLRRKDPLVVADWTFDPGTSWIAEVSDLAVYVGAPMRVRGKVLGVLSVFGEREAQWHAEDVALLGSVADHLGVAVENAWLREQAGQAAMTQERERLARDLHDAVTQSLYSLSLLAEAARERAEAGQLDLMKAHLDDLSAAALSALKEMRLLLYQLRPADLTAGGLAEALRHRLTSVERRTGIEAHVLVDTLAPLTQTLEVDLYRIAQEALNNSLQHAAATRVNVRLCSDGDHLSLEVEDDGRGFDLVEAESQAGMGLRNIRARAAQLGGKLTICSVPGQGTTVQVMVPITPAES